MRGKIRYTYKILVRKTEAKKHLGNNGIDWKDNMKMDLTNLLVRMWTGFIWFRIGSSDSLLQ
jgi:hypothetical protein